MTIPPRIQLLEAATEAWRSGSGETDAWSRAALRDMLAGTTTPEELARTVYSAIRPRTARGDLAAPKMKNGKLSVRNLENATAPVAGAAAARKNLETVLRLYDQRQLIASDLEAFANGDKSWKLYGLAAALKTAEAA